MVYDDMQKIKDESGKIKLKNKTTKQELESLKNKLNNALMEI